MKKYLTILFEYEEGAKLPGKLLEAFKSDSMEFEDTKIVAASIENEFQRIEELEEEIIVKDELRDL